MPNERRKSIIKDSPLLASDDAAAKLANLWDQVEKFVEEDLGDGFQLRDIYSLVAVIMNGLEMYFQAESGQTLKKYALFLVEKVLGELVSGGIIPSEISMLAHFVPVGMLVDWISDLAKNPPFVNRLGAAPDVSDASWVRSKWVSHKRVE
jgi:hypothetical protein